MKVFIGGREDIRPLGSEDAKLSPLPYLGVGRLFKSTTGIVTNATASLTVDADDWGTGLDFYFTGFTASFLFSGSYNAKSGPFLKVYEPTSGEVFYSNTFNQSRKQWTRIGANMITTVNFKQMRKLTATQEIQFDITNLALPGTRTLNFSLTTQGIPK